jgi:hypothetical protein
LSLLLFSIFEKLLNAGNLSFFPPFRVFILLPSVLLLGLCCAGAATPLAAPRSYVLANMTLNCSVSGTVTLIGNRGGNKQLMGRSGVLPLRFI